MERRCIITITVTKHAVDVECDGILNFAEMREVLFMLATHFVRVIDKGTPNRLPPLEGSVETNLRRERVE